MKDLLIKHKIILPSGKMNGNTPKMLKTRLELKSMIWNRTSFVLDDELSSCRERMFCIINDIHSAQLCPYCNKQIAFSNGRYNTYCSSSCSYKATNDSRLKTNNEKYGCSFPVQNKDVLQKSKDTNNEKYGSDWHQSTEAGKQQRLDTIKEKYGVDNPFKSKELRDKSKSTMIERYGVTSPIQNEEIRNRIKNTTQEIYGVDHISHSSIVQQKIINTNRERYGVDYPLSNTEILDKTRDSLFELYGVRYPGHSDIIRERAKETTMLRYGYESIFSSPEYQANSRQTRIEKYGVNYHNQHHMVDIMDLILDYSWLYDQYINMSKTAKQIGLELGIDGTTVCRYLRKAEIEIRSSVRYSYMCITWLDEIAQRDNIHIQHALNGGEYKIPGTNFRADGYCAETNTVYEFHGDVFHGNPAVFKSDEQCHPFNEITAGELYQNTILRENTIKQLGYSLVVMWESDYNIMCLNPDTGIDLCGFSDDTILHDPLENVLGIITSSKSSGF